MRKISAMLLGLLLVGLCACGELPQNPNTTRDEIEIQTTMFTPQDFTGSYQRTNCPKGNSGELEISQQEENSFYFFLDCWGGANQDQRLGTAKIISPNTAVYYGNDDAYYSQYDFVVTFSLCNGDITIDCDGEGGWDWSANGARFFGEYTKEEPVYTNANIVQDVFPSQDTRDRIQRLLGEDVYQSLLVVMENGQAYFAEEGEFDGFLRGVGEGAHIVVRDDLLYCLAQGLSVSGFVFYTNDKNYTDTLPEFIKHSSEEDVSYIYKDV